MEGNKEQSAREFTEKYLEIESRLSSELSNWLSSTNLMDHEIEYVYQPLQYARVPHEQFVKKYCNGPKKVLFVGMNPGKDGMTQTGVPFGEVNLTRSWLKIDDVDVKTPDVQCPAKPITGFSSKTKSEPSGKNFWSTFKELSGTADKFFKNSFVYNHCPLTFLNSKGNNMTPNKIKVVLLVVFSIVFSL